VAKDMTVDVLYVIKLELILDLVGARSLAYPVQGAARLLVLLSLWKQAPAGFVLEPKPAADHFLVHSPPKAVMTLAI
jgi:hypothetical protein